jgi:hypothetical protein
VRRDLVDLALAGTIFAPHYVRPALRSCAAGSAMVRRRPSDDAEAVSQLLHGEEFAVLELSGGWAWGYCGHDHYVGYIPADMLGEHVAPTHLVTVPLALLFSAPDIKSPVVGRWSMGARFGGEAAGEFVRCDAGFLHSRHVAELGGIEPDWVTTAAQFLGAPYLWGGRGDGGLDCSGLIQLSLARAGIMAPRDTDQQEATLGMEIGPDEPLRRGDIIFFPNHVGLMVDGERVIHANGHMMAVVVEPLADLVARTELNHDKPVRARRRLKP